MSSMHAPASPACHSLTTASTDCAVCDEGYASGYQFSCSICDGENLRSAIGELFHGTHSLEDDRKGHVMHQLRT